MTSPAAMDNNKVLDYHDVLLRQADVDLLTGPHWLNDQIISFYFEYLQHGRLARFPSSSGDLLFLSGATTFLLLHSSPEEANSTVLQPLHFSSRSLVLFALNNNPYIDEAGGGTHWSLVAYTKSDNTFRHLDSHGSTNATAAEALVKVLKACCCRASTATDNTSSVQRCIIPQQQNSNDCGIYVLSFADLIVNRYVNNPNISTTDLFDISNTDITPSKVTQMRSTILQLIQQLASTHHQ